MDKFAEVYKALNAAQRSAVDLTDGPLLVIAGPGTGKTQLLSARVANILTKTDTPARNILCLTFTENGAANMRDRLTSFIGQAAYDVTINTYHAFGGDLIRRYPEYFTQTRLQSAVDELGQRQIIAEIVDGLHYQNPLKQTRHHLGDLISTISEVKRALLQAADLRLIAAENLLFIQQAGKGISLILDSLTRIPKVAQALPLFEQVSQVLAKYAPEEPVNARFGSLAQVAIAELNTALGEASDLGSTKPLTNWKNDWLVKDRDNHFTLAGEIESKRIQALAGVLEQYEAALDERGLYDFDDMILRSIRVLEQNDNLRLTLQEQYLYILLDEFQDTNAAQLRLVQLLTDNPVHEGRPNVMAVGDDDQAIYAFQGAQYSNMLDFHRMYRDVQVVNLTENYRSTADIIHASRNIAVQIQERLVSYFPETSKHLIAANSTLPASEISRCEFLSDIAQAQWVATKAKQLIDQGTHPRDIAVLAPKHRQLEHLVPYLNAYAPVSYEKRDDILQARVVRELIAMSRLVLALHDGDELTADSLWPEVLSYDFWRLPVRAIWEISWKVADARKQPAGEPGHTMSWSRALLTAGNDFRIPALLFLTLATRVEEETCETILDYLIGTVTVDTNERDMPTVYSPLRDHYTGTAMRELEPEAFYETITHLTEMRARLRAHQVTEEGPLYLRDLIGFIDMYQDAGERMVSTSPYNQQADAVQVMTVFKAKGLEFNHVFIIDLQDDVWGATSRGQSNRLTLPANLAPVRHAGATNDERLRILYVAFSRAKYGLHLTSVSQNYSGKASKRLRYLEEQETDDGAVRDLVLPENAQIVSRNDTTPPTLELLERDWHHRHQQGSQQAELQSLLSQRLQDYQLSPTHLNTFLDLEYGGPEKFFFSAILRFPEAPTTDGEFGNAIHETLEWVQHTVNEKHAMPDTREAVAYFAGRMRNKKLTEPRIALEIERGETALAAFLANRGDQFQPQDRAEYSFRRESAFIEGVHLSGKIDRMEMNVEQKTITVVDYKTGKSYSKWLSDTKLYKYRRQLCCYKLLVENSATFGKLTVPSGRLEFIEPDNNGRINFLELHFTDAEMQRTRALLQAMWQHIMQFNFPDVSQYDANLTGIKQFEQDLIDGNI